MSQEIFNAGPAADICPLCCLPLDDRHKPTSIPLLSASSTSQNSNEVPVASPPGSKNDFKSTKEGTITVRFDVPMSESGGELSEIQRPGIWLTQGRRLLLL
ncbi:hypothetical protein GGI42DRAFT_106094 [Trichoderma sp. SZMC 28013]